MSAREKAKIKAEHLRLWTEDFADFKKQFEFAQQARNAPDELDVTPNDELRNAIGDALQALEDPSFNSALRHLAYARRHIYHAKWECFAITVMAIEKHIRALLRSSHNVRPLHLRHFRTRLGKISQLRRGMPSRADWVEGGTLVEVNNDIAKLDNECLGWKGLVVTCLELHREIKLYKP